MDILATGGPTPRRLATQAILDLHEHDRAEVITSFIERAQTRRGSSPRTSWPGPGSGLDRPDLARSRSNRPSPEASSPGASFCRGSGRPRCVTGPRSVCFGHSACRARDRGRPYRATVLAGGKAGTDHEQPGRVQRRDPGRGLARPRPAGPDFRGHGQSPGAFTRLRRRLEHGTRTGR